MMSVLTVDDMLNELQNHVLDKQGETPAKKTEDFYAEMEIFKSHRLVRLLQVFERCSCTILQELKDGLSDAFYELVDGNEGIEKLDLNRLEKVYDTLFSRYARNNMQLEMLEICKEGRIAEKFVDLERMELGLKPLLNWKKDSSSDNTTEKTDQNSKVRSEAPRREARNKMAERVSELKEKISIDMNKKVALLREEQEMLLKEADNAAAELEELRMREKSVLEELNTIKNLCKTMQ